MKINEHTALATGKLLLVPYGPHHVPAYHAWMQDADLRSATASEPLTLAEEHAMQRSWRRDRDKLTFIICRPLDDRADHDEDGSVAVRAVRDDGPDRMIGDVNLFLSEPDDDDDANDDGEAEVTRSVPTPIVGEVELMIARRDLHRRGFGRAAVLVFLDYALRHWPAITAEYDRAGNGGEQCNRPLAFFRARIDAENKGSVALFEALGFVRTTAEPNYFGELELRWSPDGGDARLRSDTAWVPVSTIAYEGGEEEEATVAEVGKR